MSYGLRYYGEFKNYFNVLCRVEFHVRNFSNPETEIKVVSISDSYPGSDRDVFNPIFGREFTVQVLSESNFQFIDFHNSDSRNIRCDYYEGGDLVFSGWVLPDLFTEPYIAPPYPVSIVCRCGLGEWSESYFNETINKLRRSESDEVTATTFPDLFSIIANSLLSIDTGLKLNEAVNIYSSENDSIDYSPIADTAIDLSAFEETTVYDAVSDILRSFGARLYQMNGEWWLVRVKEFKESLSVRKWTLTEEGVNIFTTSDTKLTTFKIGRPVGNNILSSSPTLDILPAWKKASKSQSLGLIENIITNGDFSEVGNAKQVDWIDGNTYDIYPVTNWDYFDTPNTGRYYNAGEPYLFWSLANSISQKVGDIEKGTFSLGSPYGLRYQKLRFSMEYALRAAQGANGYKLNFEIKIVGETETYYLTFFADKPYENYVWTTTPSFITIEEITRVDDFYSDFPFNSFSCDTMVVPIDGELNIKIFNNDDNFGITQWATKNVSIVFIEDEDIYNEDIETTKIINTNNIYTESALETVCGDLPEIPNADMVYKFGYRGNSGVRTTNWHDRGSDDEAPLLDKLLDDYKTFLFSPQFKLSLPILSKNIKFDSSIVDYQILPKKYICISSTIDRVHSIFNGVFVEFGSWEGADWILEDGTWKDNNIWIDDDVWND